MECMIVAVRGLACPTNEPVTIHAFSDIYPPQRSLEQHYRSSAAISDTYRQPTKNGREALAVGLDRAILDAPRSLLDRDGK